MERIAMQRCMYVSHAFHAWVINTSNCSARGGTVYLRLCSRNVLIGPVEWCRMKPSEFAVFMARVDQLSPNQLDALAARVGELRGS